MTVYKPGPAELAYGTTRAAWRAGEATEAEVRAAYHAMRSERA